MKWTSIPIISCNSFYFYIKPQLLECFLAQLLVVIHSISTSNHNEKPYNEIQLML